MRSDDHLNHAEALVALVDGYDEHLVELLHRLVLG